MLRRFPLVDRRKISLPSFNFLSFARPVFAAVPSSGNCRFGYLTSTKRKMDYEDDPDVAERDPAGQYVRYNEILGRGAFKTVYKGFDEGNGIEIAWNQVRLDEVMHSQEQLGRLYAEVHLVKSLKHENIIKSHHSWVDDKNMTINMITELFTSGSLRQYRKKHNKVDMKAIKNWARQILAGLKYLHTQNPPIMHRDLKCDNIFVNGHTGKVKIGDLGLAAVMQLPTAHSVIGTPEFMAPELYEEEYNELVDIYSFGMCMLEIITCEYPYSECKNPAQIYKKVTNGLKPASLAKVTDPQAKYFIERCLAPVSIRPPAEELLKDPFLASSNSGGAACDCPPLSGYKPESKMPEYYAMDVDVDHNKSSSSMSSKGSTEAELTKVNKINSFRLRGKLGEDDSVEMSLRITDMYGQARNIHFPFYLHADTTLSIAGEMVHDLELPNEDAVSIAELMDDLIKILVPGSGLSFAATASEGAAGNSVEDSLIAHDDVNFVRCSSSPDSPMVAAKSIVGQEDLHKPGEYGSSQGSLVQDRCVSTVSSECSGLSSRLEEKLSLSAMSFLTFPVECSELELQIDAIESKYRQCCEELFKLREEAIADAIRKCSMKKISVA